MLGRRSRPTVSGAILLIGALALGAGAVWLGFVLDASPIVLNATGLGAAASFALALPKVAALRIERRPREQALVAPART